MPSASGAGSLTGIVMPIPSGSSIRLVGEGSEWAFTWTGFDLDDSFDLFLIGVKHGQTSEKFEFGPCLVWGLRKLTKFFEGGKQEDEVGGGFRNPDMRFYELRRRGQEYLLLIRFEGSGLKKEFAMRSAEALVDRKFLNIYEGREA